MRRHPKVFIPTLIVLIWLLAISTRAASTYVPATMEPPGVIREFRAAWVASVANIDWPSKPGLPVVQQQAEMLSLLERAKRLNLNAILLQVRPACDAIYPSKLEPWSYYLTGTMGKPPEPFYDPLEFAITEAHKRGLELHAWFNPFRANHPSATGPMSPKHISVTRPDLVRKYGQYLWLDPGEKDAQDYSLKVVMDVVKRYDIDGVAFDDYYYPYKEKDAHSNELAFPDNASWRKYGVPTRLSRDDWRRENINTFIRRVYSSIKANKPWVKLGISPFGIWQPGFPASVKGLNSYAVLYADSRKWLTNGWMDYCVPQLYWAIDSKEQSYPALLDWWLGQNSKQRHLWPGLSDDRVGGKWTADEITNQIRQNRSRNAGGEVHWSMKGLQQDRGGIDELLTNRAYTAPAVVPASPWLETKSPAKPKLVADASGNFKWKPSNWEQAEVWLLQIKMNDHWETHILPKNITEQTVSGSPEVVAVTVIDRCGVASPAAVLQLNPGVNGNAPGPSGAAGQK